MKYDCNSNNSDPVKSRTTRVKRARNEFMLIHILVYVTPVHAKHQEENGHPIIQYTCSIHYIPPIMHGKAWAMLPAH